MFKNPWFTLVIGLMVGPALGYVFAERQTIPPGKALRLGAQAGQQGGDGLPEGHPPVDGDSMPNPEAQALDRQIAEIQTLLAQSPEDVGLMVALANTYFDDDKRAVAIYTRDADAAPMDPRLEGLDDQERQQISMVQQQLAGVTAEQVDVLRQNLAGLEAQAAQVPEENQDMVQLMIELIRERIAELEEEGQ